MSNRNIIFVILGLIVVVGGFFVFFFLNTIYKSEPSVMKLSLPKENIDSTRKLKNPLSVIILNGDKVYCYIGDSIKNGHEELLSNNSFREFLVQQKQKSDSLDFVVLIKATDKSEYKSVVSILDEMAINGIKQYVLSDISSNEKEFVKNYK